MLLFTFHCKAFSRSGHDVGPLHRSSSTRCFALAKMLMNVELEHPIQRSSPGSGSYLRHLCRQGAAVGHNCHA